VGFGGAAALGGGAMAPGFLPASGPAVGAACTAGAVPETPGLNCPAGAVGAVAPMAGLEPGAAPGAVGAADPGGAAPGFALGLTAPGDTAALGGAGGVPLAPGTGSALVLGKGWVEGSVPGALAGCVAFGLPACPAGAPGKLALTAGLIVALGGTGALPCWISVALCATAGGSVGVAPPPCAGATAAAGEPGRPIALAPGRLGSSRPESGPTAGDTADGGRLLMTLLMTALLWMLAKMMLFGGGAT
jgi:collagen type IV alpha